MQIRPNVFATQNLEGLTGLEIANLYPAWEADKAYAAMEIVRRGTNEKGNPQLFQVMQAHSSQSGWEPKDTPALYKKIGFTDAGVPSWVQPLGATDAYQVGAKVSHKDKIWLNTVANNVWEPGVYGWVSQP